MDAHIVQAGAGVVETIAVEDFRIHSDLVLRTDAATGATPHLLDIEITGKQRPQLFDALARRYFVKGKALKYVRNERSGKVALLLPTRGLITDAGERIDRFVAIRPLRDEYLTADQLAESNWADIEIATFEALWRAETAEAIATPKSEQLLLATGLLLPSGISSPINLSASAELLLQPGVSFKGREISQIDITDLSQKLGLELSPSLPIDEVVDLVLKTGKALPLSSIEPLMLKRSLVNGSQRLELTGWSAERLAWYKAQGCFTEIIRYQTRLFLPLAGADPVLASLANARS